MKRTHYKLYIIVALLLISTTMLAYSSGVGLISYPGGKCYMFRVTLRDKNGTPFSLDKPDRFLSKALSLDVNVRD